MIYIYTVQTLTLHARFSLVHFLANGDSMREAMRKGNIVASMSVQKEGTQTSYPWSSDLPSL